MTPYVWVFFSEPTGMALVVRKCDYMPTVSPDHRRGYWKKAVIEEYQPPTPAASDPVTENIVSNKSPNEKHNCHYGELVNGFRLSAQQPEIYIGQRVNDVNILCDYLVLAEVRAERYRVALEWYAANCSGPNLERQWMRTPTNCKAKAALGEP